MKRKIGSQLGLICLLTGLLATGSASAGIELVRNGEAATAIVLAVEPHALEQRAADELVEHIQLISGAILPVVKSGAVPEGLTPIRIGAAADAELEALILEHGNMPDSFILLVDDQGVQLRGLSPLGARHAAYEMLEQLGVRWFIPGEIGRVVPRMGNVTLMRQRTVQVPSFKTRDQRSQHRDDTWAERVRENRGYGHGRSRPGTHSTGGSPDRSEQPQYWAMRADGSRGGGQLCLTGSHDNPGDPADPQQNYVLGSVTEHFLERLRRMPPEALKERIVFNVGPRDGGGFCVCAMCKALDPDVTTPFATPRPSHTDRYVWFFNQVTKAIRQEFPDADVLFGFYAYGALMHPPQAVQPMGNLAISVAPIHLCRIHGPNNPVCPESDYYSYKLRTWEPYVEEVWCRGYTWNLADPQFLFPLVHRLREEIPLNYRYKLVGYGTDANHSWAAHLPANYVAAKLMWDHTLDVDALMADFYDKFYGPASEPMGAYHSFLDATIRDADHHTGSIWDIPLIYPPETRTHARGLLEQATVLAGTDDDELFATRVLIQTRAMDYLDAYCELRARRQAFDFAGEWQALERVAAMRDSLLNDFEYPMLHPRHATSLFERFVARPTRMIYESLNGGTGDIVARLDYEWQFQLDPESWGQYIGLHRPESAGGNWQTLRADTSWSNQGLRYYFGQAWYRQTVEVPAEFAGRTVNIWFAGVDNTAEVWVNGHFVGANHGGAEFDLDAYGSSFRPFQFAATHAINFGGPNVVTVRAVRPGTNELGTGGIVGPVMFYAPAE